MAYSADSSPCSLLLDLEDFVVPDTLEHFWPSDSAIGESVVVGTLTDTVVPETQFDSSIPEYVDCGCGCPYYGPPPPATPSGFPPASPIDPAQATPHRVYSDVERQMLAILLQSF